MERRREERKRKDIGRILPICTRYCPFFIEISLQWTLRKNIEKKQKD